MKTTKLDHRLLLVLCFRRGEVFEEVKYNFQQWNRVVRQFLQAGQEQMELFGIVFRVGPMGKRMKIDKMAREILFLHFSAESELERQKKLVMRTQRMDNNI